MKPTKILSTIFAVAATAMITTDNLQATFPLFTQFDIAIIMPVLNRPPKRERLWDLDKDNDREPTSVVRVCPTINIERFIQWALLPNKFIITQPDIANITDAMRKMLEDHFNRTNKENLTCYEHNRSILHNLILFQYYVPKQQNDFEPQVFYDCNCNIVKNIHDAGLTLNTMDCHGFTPLHLAVAAKNYGMVNALLQYYADVNYRAHNSARNVTPLHLAVFNGDTEMIDMLRSSGADSSIPDADGISAFQWLKNLNACHE